MTAAQQFSAPDQVTRASAKRPSRFSPSNWPVAWKVFAIAFVPLVLAGTFGGLRIYSGWTAASDLRRAADRAEMVPAIENYMATFDAAMLATSNGGDAQQALSAYDDSKRRLQHRLTDTDVAADVRTGVKTLLDGGQGLLNKVASGSIGLRERVTMYAPILLTAEDAINGSVRVDDEKIRAQTQGLSRAVGARGQMMMQQLLVSLGGELPDPELRNSMTTLAGTEPSTLFGMSEVLGVGSPEAQKLAQEMVKRMAMMSDPNVQLVNNPDLGQSIQTTSSIAGKLIDGVSTNVTSAVDHQAADKRTEAIRDSVIVGVVMLLALLVVLYMARTLIRPLRRLRNGALKVAHEDLVRELDEVRSGADVMVRPLPVHSTEEIGQVAHAVDELHEQAVLLAGEQARLQLQVSDMFETLSRRSRSLIDQQLTVIDQLERDEQDSERLAKLFRLDHLAARMRRNGANLLVLAGTNVPHEQGEPVPVTTVINAAASEVEDYARVSIVAAPDTDVHGSIAGDLVHMMAELLDNALRYSPPSSEVQVSAVRVPNGALVIEVSDAGLGMTEADLRMANSRLRSGGEVNTYTARHMGLFVVGRLATQHGLVVRLRDTVEGEPDSGTTAGIYVPVELQAGVPAIPDFGTYWDGSSTAETGATELPSFGPDTGGFATFGAVGQPAAPAEPQTQERNGFGAFSAPADEPADLSGTLLPQRNPGASGIAGNAEPPVERSAQGPTDTSSFFSARAQTPQAPQAPEPEPPARPAPAVRPIEPPRPAARPAAPAHQSTAGSEDAIYQKMLSEWLIDDPTQLTHSTDLDWQTVWDQGWSAAAAAQDAPVVEHTEAGLPVRQPGARLIPGAPDEDAHADQEADELPQRDPAAVRATLGGHFGGVHAGRSQSRDNGGR
ncbi:sensor histidine kinase [Mycobacterium sp. CBMA293]|uniref:HAMP domain-containing sensor histidine kinase n=1 Tax=unclassified Mycolicibacterium TaxID=2636767 RepID=UPI0012DBDAA7|nr:MULTISPECIES: sensor histidine kinase [unclassified Mycolicibacterium]MUL48288.1 sensor histidine kinase [Mycolicibacterium sp. CBMA 360]MUL57545.1 sensor histidine kinase [Mycolicibacterium sp. CBMA 335]MUL70585.1 sensor histidine kinase [Mycolicibacterium sp. CBMA 311]MUL92633.1 sensor histidine kinase [Mycolicibacterium sp. CBMA 230]MUM08354.1 ATP-binding protein [Mycolicibacterium sp. CBMA 213]